MKRKLNILIVTDIFPFPPEDGGKICVYGFIDALRHIQNIHLFLPIYNHEQEKIVESMKLEWSNVIIHTAREYTPETDVNLKTRFFRSAKKTGKDAINLLENSRKKDSTASDNVYINKTVSPAFSPNFIRSLTEVLHSTKFDIVQAEYTPSLNLVNVIPEGIKKVFVEIESLHELINDFSNVSDLDKNYIEYLSANAKTAELAYMSKYDAIFTLSKADKERLSRLLPGKKIYTSTYPVLDKDIAEEAPEDYTVKKIVFMGSEQHPPNKDAVFWFAKKIMPLLNLNDDVNVYITGNWQPETIKNITAFSNRIQFTGFIDDIKPLLENSISIAPIRLGGGGVRTKLIYAMASNSSVVTTSTASIGLIGKDEKAFIVADTEQAFANSITALLNDSKLSETLVKQGKAVIQKHYTQKVLAERRNDFYYEIMDS